ncbi:MFS transporter [Halorussus halophilus]|uniref:MFS transporter n=1 Tax=Halorussus halophilus TaxID=2650975 RepID=UPI001300F631|nr:MFS transporter [Halorussus halophilus]
MDVRALLRSDDDNSERWRSVFAIAGWQTAASLCYYSIFAATAFVREGFEISRTLVGVFLTAAMVGYTLNLFPSGAAVDGFGESKVMIAGLLALGGGVVAVSLAPTYAILLAASVLLGAAYATAMPASNKGIVAAAPRGRENLAMGIKQVGVTAGSGAASLVVTGVAAVAAWQLGFWTIAVVAVGYAAIFALTYSGTDGSGSLSRPDFSGLGQNRAYLLLVAAGLFVGATIFSMLGYVILYVQDVVAASAAAGGVVLALAQVTGSVGRVGSGSLADRLGDAHGAATVSLAQLAGAVVLFALLAFGDLSLTVAAVVFGALGLTVLGMTGVYYSCLSDIVASEDVGTATAGGQTAINVGGLLTPPAFGFLADTFGYDAGWAMLAVLTVCGTLLLWGVRRETARE